MSRAERSAHVDPTLADTFHPSRLITVDEWEKIPVRIKRGGKRSTSARACTHQRAAGKEVQPKTHQLPKSFRPLPDLQYDKEFLRCANATLSEIGTVDCHGHPILPNQCILIFPRATTHTNHHTILLVCTCRQLLDNVSRRIIKDQSPRS
jgi:hypothetical protein